MNCPNCGSGDCASYQAVHASGTTTSRGTAVTVGGLFRGGSFAATTLSRSVGQSNLAASCSPPTPRTPGCLTVPGIGALIFLMFLLTLWLKETGGEIWVVIVCLCALSALRIRRYNRTTYPALLARWQRSWVCLRCDKRFLVG